MEKDKQETKLLSMLELKRMKFVQNKKIKLHEDEVHLKFYPFFLKRFLFKVIKRLNQFKEKLNSETVYNDDENWMKHTLWYSEGNKLTYKPVILKPLTVESFPPKERTF